MVSHPKIEHIVRQLEAYKISKREFCRYAQVDPSQLSRWEKGEQVPRPSTLVKLDRALSVLLYGKAKD